MTILSNCNVGSVRDQVRMDALQSFEFFANRVLGSSLSDELCQDVQDAVRDREDCEFHTTQPRALSVALYAWLASQGVQVVTSAKLPQHEVLHWLELLGEPTEDGTESVVVEVQPQSVRVRWV